MAFILPLVSATLSVISVLFIPETGPKINGENRQSHP